MNCIKCGNKMVRGAINTRIDIWGEEEFHPSYAPTQKSYSPMYVYVCEECGYMEFYTNKKDDK